MTTPGGTLPGNGTGVGLETTTTVTLEECFKNFRKYIDNEKRGTEDLKKIALQVFYKDDKSLQDLAPAAKTMVESLFALGCGKEIALQLSVLILYDLVMLIGLTPTSHSLMF